MKITMKKEIKIPPEALLKIKKILDAIQKRRALNPSRQTFDFELGGFRVPLKNENDYLELVDALEGSQERAGIRYNIEDFYFDHLGRKHFYTLYDSKKCKIIIIDDKKLNNFHHKILRECESIEKTIKKDTQKPSKKEVEISSCKLPVDTKWEDLILQFLDGYTLKIEVLKLNFRDKKSYEAMGFLDRKRMMPNKQWEFLKMLAEHEGKFYWGLRGASLQIKKRKHLLSKILREYFGISGDPFLLYRKEKIYQTKFRLLPEGYKEMVKLKKELSQEEIEKLKRDREIQEFYKNQIGE